MKKIKKIKKLGHKKAIAVLSYALVGLELLETIVVKPAGKILPKVRISIGEAFRPTTYEAFPVTGKRVFNYFEALWSYSMAVIPIMLLILVALALEGLNQQNSSIEKIGLIAALFCSSGLLLSATLANGNRALARNNNLQ